MQTNPPRILVVGDSHVVAVQAAWRAAGSPKHIRIVRVLKKAKGQFYGDISFENALGEIADDHNRLVVSMLGGNQHSVYLFDHEHPFDFFEPDEVAIDNSRTLVPYGALYDVFAQALDRDLVSLHNLRKAARRRIVHVAAPPPKADENHIRKKFPKHFVTTGSNVSSLPDPSNWPLTPARIRAKLWRLQQRVVADHCAPLDIEYLPPPHEAAENGFLKPPFYANDTSHANTAYGDLLLRQLEAQSLLGYQ